MLDSRAQAASEGTGVHLVLYDGVCGLCNRLVQFVLAHDHRAVFRFGSIQSATGQAMVERIGGDPLELNTLYVFANYRTRDAHVFKKSGAALFVVGELPWPWRMLRLLRIFPTKLLDWAYDGVARSRYRVFGRFEHCRVPPPEFKNRFVD